MFENVSEKIKFWHRWFVGAELGFPWFADLA